MHTHFLSVIKEGDSAGLHEGAIELGEVTNSFRSQGTQQRFTFVPSGISKQDRRGDQTEIGPKGRMCNENKLGRVTVPVLNTYLTYLRSL